MSEAVAPDALMLRHLEHVVGTPIALYEAETGAERWIAALHIATTYERCATKLVCVVDEHDTDRARVLRRQVTELALANAHVVVANAAQRAACRQVASRTLEPSAAAPSELARVLTEVH